MKVKASLNTYVHVKLTKFGISVMEARYDSIFSGRLAECRPKVDIDENGYTTFQLWAFMQNFGEYAYAGIVEMPYDINIIIDNTEFFEWE